MPDLGDIYGFGPVLLDRVGKRWPALLNDSRLRANPYALCDIRGIGFKLADRVGQALGIASNAPFRIEAAADYVLQQAEQKGHTALPHWSFAKDLGALLGVELPRWLKIPESKVVCIDGLWSRVGTLEAERAVADDLLDMLAQGDADYDLLFSADGLAPDQLQALQAMRRARLFALIGSPGVGKTSTIRAILSSYSPDDIALCAPTGKAAKRIEQLTRREAKTIHRLLEVVGQRSADYDDLPYAYSSGFKFRRHQGDPLDAKLVVVDEVSMLDIRLMADLCAALRQDARLLLIGDSFQLPSVGAGAVVSGRERLTPVQAEIARCDAIAGHQTTR
jgi:exodeoxyribonuclease V alpha subunit